jgi:hypothetical protein
MFPLIGFGTSAKKKKRDSKVSMLLLRESLLVIHEPVCESIAKF